MKASDIRRERENRRRAGYREIIVHAAERVILRKGFSSATMDDIAREAQLSKATIYKYIPGKGDLLFEILSHYFDDIRDKLEAVLAGPGSPAEKLRLAIGTVLKDNEDMKNITRVLWMDKAMLKLMRVFVPDAGKAGPAAAADRKMFTMFRKKRQEVIGVGARLLDLGVASGEFRRMDTGAASAFVEAVLQGYAHNRYWEMETANVPAAAEALTRFIIEGIRNPERTEKEN
jgi:AcrR family transcriptional regulator